MRDEVLETEVIDYQMPGDLSWHELIVVSTLHCSYFVVICPSTTLYLPTWSPRLSGHSFIHVFIQSVPPIYAHTIFSGEFDFGFRADIDARRAIFHSHTNTNTHTHTRTDEIPNEHDACELVSKQLVSGWRHSHPPSLSLQNSTGSFLSRGFLF